MSLSSRSFRSLLLILVYSINEDDAIALRASNTFLANNNLVSNSGKFISRSSRNYVYLNYKEAYGIRYDPSENGDENRFARPQMDAPNESNAGDEIATSSVAPQSPERNVSTTTTETAAIETTTDCIPEVMSTEPNNVQTSESTAVTNKRPAIAFTALNHKIPNKLKNNATQMVQPISSIRDTLNLIRKSIKHWFTSGVDLNAPLVNGQRFLNVFNIIKFENSECTSTQELLEEMTGICYHDYQCTEMGGTSIGECADGLGVCCICMSSMSSIASF